MKATDDRAGVLLANDPNLSKIIADAKAQVDILVVSFHFGVEYSPANTRQKQLAHAAIDAGADIVVGGHPHVMQRVETYNGKPIFYSLGNFIFDQYFSPYTLEGMVAEVSIDPKTKQLTPSEQVVPISKQFVPQPLIPFQEPMLLAKAFTP
jgi:poly-gamma-glutamate synthesis protein (capsule biosynthesis protein)